MRWSTSTVAIAALLVMGMLANSSLALASVPTNSLVILQTGGYFQASPGDINNAGVAVGHGLHPDGTRALRWNVHDPGASPDVLDSPYGAQTRAYGINNPGQVAGVAEVDETLPSGQIAYKAALWSHEGMMTLGTLPGDLLSTAFDINDSGTVVGYSAQDSSLQQARAMAWTIQHGMFALEPLPGASSSIAYSINNAGQIAGVSRFEDSGSRATLWNLNSGETIDPGTLGGNTSSALAINDAGQVVGSSKRSDGTERAFVWDAQNGMVELSGANGTSFALAVNNHGQIIGRSTTTEHGFNRATAWDAGQIIDLLDFVNPVEYSSLFHSSINDNGEIVGTTGPLNLASKPFVLRIPTPDAASPKLHLPGDITVNATGPDGAIVTYEATATSDQDPNPSLICEPPSGNTFQVGVTTVDCMATDAQGKQGTGSFQVTVRGAGDQTTDLINLVRSFNLRQGIENSLDAKLQNAQRALDAAKSGDLAGACGLMDAFSKEVQAQSSKSLTSEQAAQLLELASNIIATMGCK